MKRVLLGVLAGSVLIAAVALSGGQNPLAKPGGNADLDIKVEPRNPWSHLRINDAPESFHFAVVSDRTGGHRARIFSQAIEQLNLLQPAFVVSVGDLIDGYTKDPDKLNAQWKELQSYVCKLQMPFFYVAGNHDVANPLQEKHWGERFGRRYYHFVYRNVLFLMLCSNDPANTDVGGLSKEQIEYAQNTLRDNPDVRWT